MTDPREDLEAVLPPEIERSLEIALRSAWHPAEIDATRHEALLALALEDPFAEPSPEEIVESERLRRALEAGLEHPDAALARALRLSHSPSTEQPPSLPELPELDSPERRSEAPVKGRVIYVAFGAATALLAAAAALLLVIGSLSRDSESVALQRSEAPEAAAAPSMSRTSASLFHEPFTLERTTARVDLIATVRERELRQNLYRGWGVR